MKRILFVDDDANVLQGIRRMFYAKRAEWSTEFAGNGPEALERMAAGPFDVVVSDMKMPGMTGAEFLTRVKERHPDTIRMILSGHAEQATVLKALLCAHQYLAKPCDPATLQRAIEQAFALRERLGNARLKEVVAQMRSLPALPALYRQVQDELSSPTGSLARVGELIARDVGMSASVLRIVNSAYFGLNRPMTTVQGAVTFLGTETIRTLVLSVQVFQEAHGKAIPGFSLDALWNRSLETALCARTLGRREKVDTRVLDDAFLAGFFHDVGQLVLAQQLSAQYAAVLADTARGGRALAEVECERLGATHGDVGAYLLALWGMPDPIVDAVARHDAPLETADERTTVRGLVHVASALVGDGPLPGAGSLEAELEALGLADHLETWREATREIRSAAPAS